VPRLGGDAAMMLAFADEQDTVHELRVEARMSTAAVNRRKLLDLSSGYLLNAKTFSVSSSHFDLTL
jgi:hypothetical protein